jgi:hypothetical protein
MEPAFLQLVDKDVKNARLWKDIKAKGFSSLYAFLDHLTKQELVCYICQKTVVQPITPLCGHNACKPCLALSIKNCGRLCTLCRTDFSTEDKLTINKQLVDVMQYHIKAANAL